MNWPYVSVCKRLCRGNLLVPKQTIKLTFCKFPIRISCNCWKNIAFLTDFQILFRVRFFLTGNWCSSVIILLMYIKIMQFVFVLEKWSKCFSALRFLCFFYDHLYLYEYPIGQFLIPVKNPVNHNTSKV